MEDLIDTVNQLQDVFMTIGTQDLNLPQIVVIGTQSSGKSSVLEHLVGKSFLPRGTGVVTRCPLVLQLLQVQEKTSVNDYAIFQHNKTKVFTDYQMISKEIEEQTNRLAGNNKGICHTPIHLKIFSTSFLNLTVVDLPGLTKIPIGDQPADIDQQTRDLTLKYITNPNSIILAVTPANADMATSESLKLAKEVDKEGVRTLAIITKLDLMDEGTDARDMLNGKIIPVKLGIIGVVNRSQKDINERKSLKESLLDEARFFCANYRNIADQHGTSYLAKTVRAILKSHIITCLPKLREMISQMLASQRSRLYALGDNRSDKSTTLLDLITRFTNTYCSSIKGNLTSIQTSELYGGARISYVFHESLSAALGSIQALSGLSKGAILTAIQNASGISPTLFVPEVAFELLMKKQIKWFRNPCLQCVDLIDNELNELALNCIDNPEVGLQRFPKFQHEVSEIVIEFLRSRLPVTNEMVNHFIDIQLAYINTAHPDFLGAEGLSSAIIGSKDQNVRSTSDKIGHTFVSSKTLDNVVQLKDQPQGHSSNLEKVDREYILIQELIKRYFSIVRKSVQDIVPKLIMHFMVNYVVNHLQSELVTRLYKSEASELLQESQIYSNKREEIKNKISALERATATLSTVTASRSNRPFTNTSNSFS